MNHIYKLLFAVILLTFMACENKMKISDSLVPKEVQNSFKIKYPEISHVEWELEKGIYEAKFKTGDIEKTARFEGNGSFVDEKKED